LFIVRSNLIDFIIKFRDSIQIPDTNEKKWINSVKTELQPELSRDITIYRVEKPVTGNINLYL